jgi:hypothetical protein
VRIGSYLYAFNKQVFLLHNDSLLSSEQYFLFGYDCCCSYISFIFILYEKWGIHIWNKIEKVINNFSFRSRLSKYRRTERKIVNCGWSILYTGIEIYFNKKKNRSLIISVGLVKCKEMIEYKRIFLNIISWLHSRPIFPIFPIYFKSVL